MTDLFANVNGIKICYDIHGKGYPVILVHGFGDKKEHWRAQVGALSKHFKVVRFDNRGCGKSDRPDGPYSMELYADDINALMDYLKIEKAHIAGHSLGGMIVQNFVLKYPLRTNKVILINTLSGITLPGVPSEKGLDTYRTGAITRLKEFKEDPLNMYLKHAKSGFSRPFWKLMIENPKKKFHGLWSVEDLVQEKLKNPTTLKDIENQMEALKTHNVYDRLPTIKNEVLILAAEKDKSCTPIMNKKTHELIPNSKLIIIEKVSHQSLLEKAPEINKVIIDFLKS